MTGIKFVKTTKAWFEVTFPSGDKMKVCGKNNLQVLIDNFGVQEPEPQEPKEDWTVPQDLKDFWFNDLELSEDEVYSTPEEVQENLEDAVTQAVTELQEGYMLEGYKDQNAPDSYWNWNRKILKLALSIDQQTTQELWNSMMEDSSDISSPYKIKRLNLKNYINGKTILKTK